MKNTLTIHWKSSPNFNIVSRKRLVRKPIYDTVDNINETLVHKLPVDNFKNKGATNIIVGFKNPTFQTVEQEHSVETFKNIKSLDKVHKILNKRNKENIKKVVYRGETINLN